VTCQRSLTSPWGLAWWSLGSKCDYRFGNVLIPNGNCALLKLPRIEITRIEITRIEITRIEITRIEITRTEITGIEIPGIEITPYGITPDSKLSNVGCPWKLPNREISRGSLFI